MERGFITSFNTSQDFFPYPTNLVSTLKIPFQADNLRFGGTFSKEYKFNFDYPYFNQVNVTNAYNVYSKYKGYNNRKNHIWPFIKTITEDLTLKKSVTVALPLMNFYIGSLRDELLANYKDLSKPSKLFQSAINDTMQMLDAFELNGVTVSQIEFGNEMYMDFNDRYTFTANNDRLVWSRTNNTDLSLTIYRELCSMFARILRARNKDYKFFFPLSEDCGVKGGGHALWDNYFLNNLDYMGMDGVVFHPYAKPQQGDLSTVCSSVSNQRQSYYKYLLNTVIPLLNGKLISLSEWSNSENNPILKGAVQDADLYAKEIALQRSIPQIVSSHYHALSNGSNLGTALHAAGWMKQAQVQVQTIGNAFIKLNN